MKRFLCAASVIALLASTPAHADLPVIDASNIAQWGTYIPIAKDTLSTMVNAYNTLANIYNTAQVIDNDIMRVYYQATNIYNTLYGLTRITSVAAALNAAGLQNPLPYSASMLPGCATGAMAPGSIPYGSQYLSTNTVVGGWPLAADATFMAREITNAVNSISCLQATLTGNMQALETRTQQLPSITSEIDSADSVKKTNDIIARGVMEGNYAAVQQAQATNLMSAAVLQRNAWEQRQLQAMQQHYAAQIAEACAEASGTGMAPVVAACKGGN